MEVAWKAPQASPRNSHSSFFEERDWDSVRRFWSSALTITTRSTLPAFVAGDDEFSLTDLRALSRVSEQDEFQSSDHKFSSRCTYALTIGYAGGQYRGYQQQRGESEREPRTVEDDLDFLLRRKVIVAGRTDKDVSAMSQVVSFHVHDERDLSQEILRTVERRIALADAALAQGTPYDSSGEEEAQIDAQETEEAPVLSKKQRKQLAKEQRKPSFPFSLPRSPLAGKLRVWDCRRVSRKFHPIFLATWRRYVYLFPLNKGSFGEGVDVDIDFVQRCFAHIQGKELSYNGFAHREQRDTGVGLSDLCTLLRTRATCEFLSLSRECEADTPRVLAVELVGDRFLRRMVRILVATAVRESVLPMEERDEEILLKIALSGQRERASLAAPGTGLALCGVGFDFEELADYKNERKKDTEPKENSVSVPPSAGVNPASRRRKRKNNVVSVGANISSSIAEIFAESIQWSDSWRDFSSEVISTDSLLLLYPQRAFSFSFDELIFPQSCEVVSSTIWDAEVFLAHYLDEQWVNIVTPLGSAASSPLHCVELGAGCGLAGLVAARKSLISNLSGFTLSLQEIDEETVEYTRHCLLTADHQNTERISLSFIPCKWGDDRLSTISADLVIMADVFYHEEHFSELCATIRSIVRQGGTCIFAFEQRRKDLLLVVQDLVSLFESYAIYGYRVPLGGDDSNFPDFTKLVTYFVFVCSCKH